MSSLSKEQLEELWELIGTRRAEFSVRGSPHFTFVPLTHGEVRMIYDAIEEWGGDFKEDAEHERAIDVAAIHDKAFTEGWKAGRESMKAELSILERMGGWVAPRNIDPGIEMNTDRYLKPLAESHPNVPAIQVDGNADSFIYANGNGHHADPEQIRADIKDLGAAYPSLDDEPNGKDIYAGVHPVAGIPDTYLDGAPRVRLDADDLDRQWEIEGEEQALAMEAQAAEEERLHREAVEALVGVEPPPVIEPLPEPVATAIAADSNGHHAEPSPAAVATLGPEHVVVTPLIPRRTSTGDAPSQSIVEKHVGVSEAVLRRPRTLAEVDAEATKDKPAPSPEKETAAEEIRTMRMDATQRAAQLREIVGYLQDMAEGNEMPSMATWNEKKPAHLPKADALTHRYSLNWAELARYCHLDFQGKRGPKPTFKHPLHRVSA